MGVREVLRKGRDDSVKVGRTIVVVVVVVVVVCRLEKQEQALATAVGFSLQTDV